jgi:tetratricopeptide (TPR) repeat protein
VATEAAVEQLLTYAERAGSRILVGRAMIQLVGPLMFGPFEPDVIRGRLASLRESESPLANVTVLYVEGELARRDKRFEEALGLLEQVAAIQHALGLGIGAAIALQRRAEIRRDQGLLDEAISGYRAAIRRHEELGQTGFRSTTLINLGEAFYQRGELEEAKRLATEGEQIGASEDVVNFAYGRALRARIAADEGSHETAESLARDAIAYAYKTDFPGVHAGAHRALAHVLARANRFDESRSQLEQALELWQRYGYRAEAEKTLALLDA